MLLLSSPYLPLKVPRNQVKSSSSYAERVMRFLLTSIPSLTALLLFVVAVQASPVGHGAKPAPRPGSIGCKCEKQAEHRR